MLRQENTVNRKHEGEEETIHVWKGDSDCTEGKQYPLQC